MDSVSFLLYIACGMGDPLTLRESLHNLHRMQRPCWDPRVNVSINEALMSLH